MDGILSGMGLFADKKDVTPSKSSQATSKSSQAKSNTANKATPQPAKPLANEAFEELEIDLTSVETVAATTPTNTNDRKEPMKAQPAPSVSPTPSPSSNNNVSLSDDTSPSAVIGSKITFKGELSGDEDLLIQGAVEGTVTLKGNKLTIGKLGKVKANLSAQNIIIDGTVEGDLMAEDHISINASSVVKGNVVADRVTLEDGAKFRGSIDMDVESAPSPASFIGPEKS